MPTLPSRQPTHLGLDLRRVVRVLQLGVQDQPEGGVELNLLREEGLPEGFWGRLPGSCGACAAGRCSSRGLQSRPTTPDDNAVGLPLSPYRPASHTGSGPAAGRREGRVGRAAASCVPLFQSHVTTGTVLAASAPCPWGPSHQEFPAVLPCMAQLLVPASLPPRLLEGGARDDRPQRRVHRLAHVLNQHQLRRAVSKQQEGGAVLWSTLCHPVFPSPRRLS